MEVKNPDYSTGDVDGIGKHWKKRYTLFSKFDQGIIIDSRESWYSVTPESIAKSHAQHCRHMLHHSKISSYLGPMYKNSNVCLDAFCGVGGNAIQFAKTCDKVVAIDIDPIKIDAAKNNAKIYGVENKIEFIVGDFFQVAPSIKADVVFLSPPWGGPKYKDVESFDIQNMNLDGIKVFDIAKNITENICYYLPKNTNRKQLVSLSRNGRVDIKYETIRHPFVVALTAYYGNLCSSRKYFWRNRG